MKNGFSDLLVWQKSINLAKLIYKVTENFPKSEIYGLTGQIRRSAVSIASNIAEGAARSGKKEFAQFLSVALGSITELKTQLIIASEIEFLSQNDFEELFKLTEDISRMTLKLKEKISL